MVLVLKVLITTKAECIDRDRNLNAMSTLHQNRTSPNLYLQTMMKRTTMTKMTCLRI